MFCTKYITSFLFPWVSSSFLVKTIWSLFLFAGFFFSGRGIKRAEGRPCLAAYSLSLAPRPLPLALSCRIPALRWCMIITPCYHIVQRAAEHTGILVFAFTRSGSMQGTLQIPECQRSEGTRSLFSSTNSRMSTEFVSLQTRTQARLTTNPKRSYTCSQPCEFLISFCVFCTPVMSSS